MILQELVNLYDRLAVSEQVPKLFHSSLPIGLDVIINDRGNILSATSTVKNKAGYPVDIYCQVSPKSDDRRNDWYKHPHGIVEQLRFFVQCGSSDENFVSARDSYISQLKALACESGSPDVKALLRAVELLYESKPLDELSPHKKLENAAAQNISIAKNVYAKNWDDLINHDSSGRLIDTAGKLHVRWRLVGGADHINEVPEVQAAWTRIQERTSKENAQEEFKSLERKSTLSGEVVLPATTIDHLTIPRKRGKLVSFNEIASYNTYSSAAFADHELYVSGVEEVQKYGQAMRWLATECGVRVGDILYLVWREDADTKPHSLFYEQLGEDKAYELGYGDEVAIATECKQLVRARLGMQADLKDLHDVSLIGIRLSKGRLSLVAFHRMTLEDFAEANAAYIEDTAMVIFDGKAKSVGFRSPTVRAPINHANPESKLDKKNKIPVWWDAMHRVALFKSALPISLVNVLIRKALAKQEEKTVWLSAAAYRNHLIRTRKENVKMALDLTCRDRSYRAGRLIAVHYWIQTDRGKGNPNNKASSLMQSTVSRPQLLGRIEQASIPYLRRMNAALKRYFENLLGEIYDPLPAEGFGSTVLDPGRVVVGYHHQLTALKAGGKTFAVDAESKEAD